MKSNSPAEEHNVCLESLLTCLICFKLVQDAQSCPRCSKFFCLECILPPVKCQQSTLETVCPNCHQKVRKEDFINCTKLCKQLIAIVGVSKRGQRYSPLYRQSPEAFDKTRDETKRKEEEHYTEQSESANKSCDYSQSQTLKTPNQNIGQYDKPKTTDHIKKIYCLDKVDENADGDSINLSKKSIFEKHQASLVRANSIQSSIQNLLLGSKEQSKAAKALEQLQAEGARFRKYLSRHESVHSTHQTSVIVQKQERILKHQAEYESLLKELEGCSPLKLVGDYSQMLQTITKKLQDSKSERISRQKDVTIERSLQSHIFPPFETRIFECGSLKKICQDKEGYSTQFRAQNGLLWELKVELKQQHQTDQNYIEKDLSGCQQQIAEKKDFTQKLSVWLKLKKTLRPKGNYRYRVGLFVKQLQSDENGKQQEQGVQRSFESTFEQGERWGWEEFAEINHLISNFRRCFHGKDLLKQLELKAAVSVAPSNYRDAILDLNQLYRQRMSESVKNRARIAELQKRFSNH